MPFVKPFLFAFLAIFVISCGNQAASETETTEVPEVEEVVVEEPKDLFSKLSTYCGKTYQGKLIHSYAGPDFYKEKPMLITLEYCNDSEISIPFSVGEDRSKIWKFSKTESGFQLKHQEVDQKGNPKKITNYGGAAVANEENPFALSFPADEATAEMISVAKENVWMLDLDPTTETLTYTIKRKDETRFSAAFDLTTPTSNEQLQ